MLDCRRSRHLAPRSLLGGQHQPAPGARDVAVAGLVRVLPAEAMVERQRRGVAGSNLEGGRFAESGQPLRQQGPADPLAMPVRRHIKMMHEAVRPPDGDKAAEGSPLLRDPDVLAPGLLGEICQPEQGGLDPLERLPPALEKQLRQHGRIRGLHRSDHEEVLFSARPHPLCGEYSRAVNCAAQTLLNTFL